MRALERGDYENAATTLQDFADAHPSDARADEADYIRAIALQRAGRAADAKAAARLYLSKWPKGAHRRDAERLAND